LGADPQLGIDIACANGQPTALDLRFAAGATCTCGKSNDDHTDEYLESNHTKTMNRYFDEIMIKCGRKRPREDDNDQY
jgi:hypothetical protein